MDNWIIDTILLFFRVIIEYIGLYVIFFVATKKCFIEKLSIKKSILLILIAPPSALIYGLAVVFAAFFVLAVTGYTELAQYLLNDWLFVGDFICLLISILLMFFYMNLIDKEKRTLSGFLFNQMYFLATTLFGTSFSSISGIILQEIIVPLVTYIIYYQIVIKSLSQLNQECRNRRSLIINVLPILAQLMYIILTISNGILNQINENSAISSTIEITMFYINYVLLLFLMFSSYIIIQNLNGTQKLLDQQIIAINADAANKAKGDFLARMSHEIRTPINAILGMNTMILRTCDENNIKEQKIKDYSFEVNNSGQILLSLINDILDLSKIESGKMEILPVEYDISSLIHDVMNMVSFKAKDRNLKLLLNADPNLPCRLFGDDIRIRQILVNLLNNAVKYTNEGTVTLDITGEPKDDGILLHVAVKDTGVGIKKENMGRLFAEFERIEEDMNHGEEGTGLGMSITIKLLQLMDSKLQIDSIYGKGSVFYFDLYQQVINSAPIGDLNSRISTQKTSYEYKALFYAPDAQILLVDDNSVNRKVFINLLEDTGVNIDEASNGLECINMAERKRYDAIFLDHMMPDLDGITTLQRLKNSDAFAKINSKTPVVALTANAITGAKEMYLQSGFSAYLSKPIKPIHLENMLYDLIDDTKLLAANEKPIQTDDYLQKIYDNIGDLEYEYAMLHMKNEKVLDTTLLQYTSLQKSELNKLELFYKKIFDNSCDTSNALENYRIQIHSMKNSAFMIGAISIGAIAKTLEYSARDHQIDTLTVLHPIFVQQWISLGADLANSLPEHDVSNKQALDITQLFVLLDSLEDVMMSFDMDKTDELAKNLNSYTYEENLKNHINELCEFINNLDIDNAIAKKNMILNSLNRH